MTGRTWHFHTVPVQRGPTTIGYQWTWRRSDGGEETLRAAGTFFALNECIADAKAHGFPRTLDLANSFRVGDRQDVSFAVEEGGDGL